MRSFLWLLGLIASSKKIPIPFTGSLHSSFLGLEIHVCQSKTESNSLCPFKVICKDPDEVAIYAAANQAQVIQETIIPQENCKSMGIFGRVMVAFQNFTSLVIIIGKPF